LGVKATAELGTDQVEQNMGAKDAKLEASIIG